MTKIINKINIILAFINIQSISGDIIINYIFITNLTTHKITIIINYLNTYFLYSLYFNFLVSLIML